MINAMTRDRHGYERVTSALSLLFMIVTVTASLLIIYGTFGGRSSLKNWGAILSLPAIAWISLSIIAAAALLLYWLLRAAFRMVVPGPPSIDGAYAIDLQKGHAHSQPVRVISDDEILALLQEHAAVTPRLIAWQDAADSAVARDTARATSAAPQRTDPTVEAVRRNVPFKRLSENSFLLQIPASPNSLGANSDFERTCIAFLEQPARVEHLVIDGRGVDQALFDRFLDFLQRLIESVGERVSRHLRVLTANTDIIEGFAAMLESRGHSRLNAYIASLSVFLRC